MNVGYQTETWAAGGGRGSKDCPRRSWETTAMTKSSKSAFSKVNFWFLQKVDFVVLLAYCYVNNLHQNFLKSEHLLWPMERLPLTLMGFGSGPKCKYFFSHPLKSLTFHGLPYVIGNLHQRYFACKWNFGSNNDCICEYACKCTHTNISKANFTFQYTKLEISL